LPGDFMWARILNGHALATSPGSSSCVWWQCSPSRNPRRSNPRYRAVSSRCLIWRVQPVNRPTYVASYAARLSNGPQVLCQLSCSTIPCGGSFYRARLTTTRHRRKLRPACADLDGWWAIAKGAPTGYRR
jgi:hypothetical protein